MFYSNWFYNSYKFIVIEKMVSDKTLIYRHLDKSLKSRHLNKSKISCDLLKYLVEASLEGKNPKEYTIGIDLFGRKYGPDKKQDANIRVYIHNLRKKLKDYYADEGRNDQVIFEIEKGKYNVLFISKKEYRAKHRPTYFTHFLISLAILISTLAAFLLTKKGNTNAWDKLPVWQKFTGSDKKTMLVFGDYFVFEGILPSGKLGIFRDFEINSEAEYEHLLDKQPELAREIDKSNLTYLSKMSVFCQNEIMKVFAQNQGNLEVKLSSDMQPDDLKEYNIIFIGNYKNTGIFETIIKGLDYNFEISNAGKKFITSGKPDAVTYKPGNDSFNQNDYALAIFTKGYNDNHFLFFLSTRDIGNISIVRQFTNLEHMQQLSENHLGKLDPENFKALYRVDGINKTDLSFELVLTE